MKAPRILGENLFDDFFNDFFDFPAFPDKAMRKAEKELYGHHAANMMKTDVKEKDDHYEVDIDLPGFSKDELSLELRDGYLIIRAAKGLNKDEQEKETGKFVRRERYVGSMTRSFFVGEELKEEDIHAKYENGVLQLSVPKPEPKKAVADNRRYIAIEG